MRHTWPLCCVQIGARRERHSHRPSGRDWPAFFDTAGGPPSAGDLQQELLAPHPIAGNPLINSAMSTTRQTIDTGLIRAANRPAFTLLELLVATVLGAMLTAALAATLRTAFAQTK